MSNMSDEAARRWRRACQHLGTEAPACCLCGESNPHCLELHHIAGRLFGDESSIVCRNCHRKLSDAQKDHPVPLAREPSILERIGHYLLGLSDKLNLYAEMLKRLGIYLIGLAKAGLGVPCGEAI